MELGNLSYLETLDLASNNLSSPIPKQLGRFWKLSSLNLSENRFVDSIPDKIRKMHHLELCWSYLLLLAFVFFSKNWGRETSSRPKKMLKIYLQYGALMGNCCMNTSYRGLTISVQNSVLSLEDMVLFTRLSWHSGHHCQNRFPWLLWVSWWVMVMEVKLAEGPHFSM